jgi:alginate O-acetyltransferase complex protein AlgI
LGGLWHGASWNFILWGALHGAALAVHKLWTTWDPFAAWRQHRLFNAVWTTFSRVLTLGVVLFGWVFFRSPTWGAAVEYVQRLLLWTPDGIRMVSPYILPAVAAVFVTHLFINKDREWAHEIPLRPFPIRLAAYSCLMILFVCLAATDVVPFIYFQF